MRRNARPENRACAAFAAFHVLRSTTTFAGSAASFVLSRADVPEPYGSGACFMRVQCVSVLRYAAAADVLRVHPLAQYKVCVCACLCCNSVAVFIYPYKYAGRLRCQCSSVVAFMCTWNGVRV